MSTAIICSVILLICIYAVISYRKKIRNGCCGAGGDSEKRIRPADKNKAAYTHKVIVQIDGMSCANCALRVENAFNSIPGYYAKVKLGEKCAYVLSKTEPDKNAIEDIVRRAGYVPVSIDVNG